MSGSGPVRGPRGAYSTTPMSDAAASRGGGFGAVLQAPAERPVGARAGAAGSSDASERPAGALAAAVFEDEAAIEDALNRIERGESMDREELLALQARVYAYSQRVEVASRLVDRAAGALRHLLNIQL